MKKFGLKIIYWILAAEARKVINIHKPFVIGITGSAGKSSTKEAVYQVLHDRFGDNVRKSHGNFNSEMGLPLAILGYGERKSAPGWLWPVFLIQTYLRTFQKKFPKYLVLELGVDKPGDIAYFGRIIKLDIAIITSVSGAHLANFAMTSDYQAEKLSILKIIKDGGIVIANRDDAVLAKIDFPKTIFYAVSDRTANFYAENIKLTLAGTEYRICGVGQKIAIRSELLGPQFVASALAAFAVGQNFLIQSLQIKKSLEKIKPMSGRMRIIAGKKKCILIDDTYNASPVSVKAALDVLSEIKYTGRKVAILGNMNELGQFEAEEHRLIGEYSRNKADLIVFVGKNAHLMAKANGQVENILTFDNRQELIKPLNTIIKSDDLILIKASQNNNFFEEVTKQLLKNPAEASELLVRQSKKWMKKK